MKTQLIKKQLVATSIILAIATTPVMASSNVTAIGSEIESQNESAASGELIGFSTGAVIGGFIAGPFGVAAAGVLGLIIGQSHERQEKVELAELRLAKNQMVIQTLANEKKYLKDRLVENEKAQKVLINELAITEKTLSQADTLAQIKLNLRFEVDSAQVESFYHAQIKHLAMMMQENPDLSVSLSGFSDPTGDENSNLKLSQARAESVKSLLVSQGANENNIFTQAFGESTASQISRTESSDFNNRRVDVELISQEKALTDVKQHQVIANVN